MAVPVTGLITTYPGGVYPVIDPLYGIDGWRSVADHAARNAIVTDTPLRYRQGMVVVTQNDLIAWQATAASPDGTDGDWTEFSGGAGSTITLSGDASGSGTSAITVTVSSYDGGTTFGTMAHQDASAVAITGGTITGLPSPTAGSDAATKTYVDSLATGLSPRTSCRVATAAALTATYANGSSGVGATLTNATTQAAISIDGVSLSSADRVLVKDQASQLQNGIYTVTTVGSGATNWVLTRATDYDSAGASEVVAGSYTVIVSGTVNAETLWVETGVGPFTIGVTAIVFNQLAAAGITTVLTGDVTGTGLGAVTTTIANLAVTTAKINTSAVTYAKVQNVAAVSLLGNPTGSGAAPSEIGLGAGLSFSGTDLVAAGSGGTVTSVATGTGLTGGPITTTGTVSLDTITSHNVLANTTSGTAAPAGVTLTSLIDAAISGTQGTILYRGSASWSALAPGSNGNVLTTHGAAANPTWGTAGGAGTVTSVATGAGLTGGPITATGTIALAAIANNTLLANVSGGSLAPSATTPSAVLDIIGAAQGDILYRDSGGWAVLAPGSDGDVLTTHGAAANPTWAAAAGGSGTVTTVSVATANGLAGTVATATTTPVITLTTSVTGILKGNGTAISAAVADTDYATPAGVIAYVAGQGFLTANQTITLSGDVSGSGATAITTTIGAGKVLTAMLAAANVTYAKIQNVTAVSLLGNPTGSGASPSEITLGSGLSFSGTTLVSTGTGGTVTSLTGGTGITLTPSTITATGSIALTTPVAVTSGGTGIASYVPGDLLYASGSTALGRVAGNTTATKEFLSGTGSGGVAQLPVWGVIAAADLPATGLTITQHSGSIATDADGATITFDLAASDWHQVQLGGNRTLALSNPTTGQQFSIILQQDGSTRTVTWFSGILWPGGTIPTLTAGGSKRDVFTFKTVSAGVYLGFIAGQNL